MELVGQLNTDIDRGMTKDQAATRLSDEGPNQLTEKKGLPWYCVLLKEMTGFFSLLLWFGAILCFIGYAINQDDPSNLYLGIVLSAVTLVTGFFTFYQTSKSASLMAFGLDARFWHALHGHHKFRKCICIQPGIKYLFNGGVDRFFNLNY